MNAEGRILNSCGLTIVRKVYKSTGKLAPTGSNTPDPFNDVR
jgi:hypothetical protein